MKRSHSRSTYPASKALPRQYRRGLPTDPDYGTGHLAELTPGTRRTAKRFHARKSRYYLRVETLRMAADAIAEAEF